MKFVWHYDALRHKELARVVGLDPFSASKELGVCSANRWLAHAGETAGDRPLRTITFGEGSAKIRPRVDSTLKRP